MTIADPPDATRCISTRARMLELLRISDSYAVGERQRIAIALGIATLETDCAGVKKRLQRWLDEHPEHT